MRRINGDDDTICAISTPIGSGGIGIIRVSGARAFSLVQPLFGSYKKIESFQTHTINIANIIDPARGEALDTALFMVMRAPKTYTGENVVEIQTHGNPLLLEKITSLLLAQGARLADPGEFTRRAFLSGKLDLVQAEAVMELITAQTEEGTRLAFRLLKGELSSKIDEMRQVLLGILADLEASIDFSEEGIDFSSPEKISLSLKDILKKITVILDGYDDGKKIRDGVNVVIVGRPNVGKSSLMNLLLKNDRAIVTPFPGTTRDLLEEWVNLEGMTIKLVDTAGYRETSDPIEKEGIRRAKEKTKRADLVLCLIDSSEPLQAADLELLSNIDSLNKLVILNKIDLPRRVTKEELSDRVQKAPIVEISTVKGEGIDQFKKRLVELLTIHPETERPLISLLRHKESLQQAEKALGRALSSSSKKLPIEFIAVDIRESVDRLGDIIGSTSTDDLLNEIFGRFCIGK